MKLIYKFFLMLSLLLFFSCSKDTINTPVEEVKDSSGSLNFTINKETTPSDVASVKITLSRADKPDIISTMDLTSSTSASLTLRNVFEGMWHAKVVAYNSQNEIEYTGEADVLVRVNETVYLTITLNHVDGSIGIVNITVSWGITPSKWKDYGEVLNGAFGNNQQNGVFQPNVIFERGRYRMWYTGIDNLNVTRIMRLFSPDGIYWDNYAMPQLYLEAGRWDSYSMGHAKVVKVDSIYYMYYQGKADMYGNWHVGLATSRDGSNWFKKPNPVIYGTIGNRYQYIVNAVLYMNNKFYLYLSSSSDFRTGSSEVCLATSNDGVNFDTPKPILPVTLPWEGNGIYQVSIINDEGKLKMIYNNYPSLDKLGYAESTDGINWVKNNEPIFSISEAKESWIWSITNISYVKVNDDIRLYYAGYMQGSYYYRIGLLRYNNN